MLYIIVYVDNNNMSGAKKEIILVVDDAPVNVTLLKRILENAGYGVLMAGDGRQAVEITIESDPDMVLMDIDMPLLDGYSACRQLKENDKTSAIPVIFISALDSEEDKVQAFRSGGVDYISKPFYMDEVLARVKIHLTIRDLNKQLEDTNRILETRLEELTHSQEQLRDKESKLTAFVSALPNLSFVYDEDGRYLEILANETSLLLYRPEDMKGRLIDELMPMLEAKKMMDAIHQAITTGQTQVIEYKIPVLSGGEHWFEGRIAPMGQAQAGEKNKVVFIATEITERIKLYQEVQNLACQDPLTSCFNRRHFMNLASQELVRATRYGKHLSMLMLDIDHFKVFNDTYGHPAGDRLLCELVRLCQSRLRGSDVLGRYGGEEFIFLLPEINGEQAIKAGDRLRVEIAKLAFETSSGQQSVTVSIGAASNEQEGGQTPDLETLIRRADQALYAAKTGGRNCVRLWTPGMDEQERK